MGILFIENQRLFAHVRAWLDWCGDHSLEEQLVKPQQPGELRVETPAGLVVVHYTQQGSKVEAVRFTNIPSYLAHEGLKIDHPDLGELTFDISYGGNFYAIVDPQDNFKGIEHYTADQLIAWSRKTAATRQ